VKVGKARIGYSVRDQWCSLLCAMAGGYSMARSPTAARVDGRVRSVKGEGLKAQKFGLAAAKSVRKQEPSGQVQDLGYASTTLSGHNQRLL
jgi:hypothetical protein